MPYEDAKPSQQQSEQIVKLRERLSKFETEEGRLLGLSYEPKSVDEVIITTSPKAGTTWLQQICHQLRTAIRNDTRHNMDFIEISQVVPFLELAHDQHQNLNSEQYGEDMGLPRIFKTHAWEPHCPKGCKIICMVRNPYDVVHSFYNFFEDWFFPSLASIQSNDDDETHHTHISQQDFVREFWLARGSPTSKMTNASYFHHFLSWYAIKDEPHVLFLFYEDLKHDLKSGVEKIAQFISTEKYNFNQPDIINQAVQRSSFEFMSQHEDKFDEKLSKLYRNEACGLRKDAGMQKSKLNTGCIGAGSSKLSPELKEEIDDKWRSVVQPVTGFGSYDELYRSISSCYVTE